MDVTDCDVGKKNFENENENSCKQPNNGEAQRDIFLESNGKDIDYILSEIGLGRFQIITFILIGFCTMTYSYNAILTYFIANDPPWKCVNNTTSVFCEKHFGEKIGSEDRFFASRCSLKREEWVYTTSKDYSFVTEFDLICEKSAIAAFASSTFHIGGVIGMFLSSTVADYYGRKIVIIFFLGLISVSGMLCSAVTEIWQLSVLRAFIGAGHTCCYMASSIYMIEIFPPAARAMVVTSICMMYIVSSLILTLIAYFIRSWRHLQLYIPMVCFIGIIFLFFLPRSPRWLLVNNRKDDAKNVLKRIALFNRKTVDVSGIDLELNHENEQDKQKYSYYHLLKSRHIIILTLLLGTIWFTASLAYYTLSFESSNLGGNIYQAFFLSLLAEIPSMFAATYLCDRFGRKRITLLSQTITGVLGMGITLVPHRSSLRYIFNITFAMIGKFFAEITFQGIYVWSFELYPTVVRMQGIAIGIFFERAGSFGAPFLTNVLHPINASLPYIILLSCTVLSSIGSWFVLDETMKQPTREKFEDIFVKKKTSREKEEEGATSFV